MFRSLFAAALLSFMASGSAVADECKSAQLNWMEKAFCDHGNEGVGDDGGDGGDGGQEGGNTGGNTGDAGGGGPK